MPPLDALAPCFGWPRRHDRAAQDSSSTDLPLLANPVFSGGAREGKGGRRRHHHAADPPPPPPRPAVWILAGQSNCTGWNGQDGTAIEPPSAPPDDGVLMLTADGQALERACEPTHLGVWGFDDSSAVGPGLSFARALRRSSTTAAEEVIVLVPCARGGASLCQDWSPDAPDDQEDEDGGPVDTRSGSLFGNCVRRTRRALELATIVGPALSSTSSQPPPPPRLAGLVWVQGESDGNDEATARDYGRVFLEFLARLEQALARPLPVVVMAAMAARGREGAFPFIRIVREEQLRLAAEAEAARRETRRRRRDREQGGRRWPAPSLPLLLPPRAARLFAVDMAGFEFYPDEQGNLVHLTKDGAAALGDALGLTAAAAAETAMAARHEEARGKTNR